MFTGIIAAVGKISQIQALEKGLRLTIAAPGLKLADVAMGDSISTGLLRAESPAKRPVTEAGSETIENGFWMPIQLEGTRKRIAAACFPLCDGFKFGCCLSLEKVVSAWESSQIRKLER